MIRTNAKSVIYLGPTKKGTILKNSCIFIDGVPVEYVNHNIYKHLFVSVDKLNESLAELKHKGSKLNTFYEKATRGDN